MIRFLQTPGPIKKIVLGGIIVLFAVIMVMSLIPGGFLSDSSSGSRGMLAKVGDQEVTTLEVQQAARQMGRQQFPKGFPQEFLPYLMQNAANSLILQKAILSEAGRMGLKVTDAELRDQLQQGEIGKQLFPNGQFVGREAYEDFVASNFNMGVTQFEQLVKNDLLSRKLQGMIGAGVTVSDADVQKEFARNNTKVKLEYALLTLEDVSKQLHPVDADLRAFYDKNKASRYQNSIPEKRKVKYALVDSAKILEQVKAQLKPEDLQKYYDAHQDEFRVPERVKASHILIKTPAPGADGKVDDKAVGVAQAKAADILKQLRAGANFAELAKKESQDTSAKEGGALPWMERGRADPEFEKASFSQPIGKIGEVVRSSFGFHIIRVDEREAAHLKPLAEVKDGIATKLSQEKATSAADALSAKVLAEGRRSGMESAAADNHLQVVTSDWFSRTDSIPGIGPSPEFAGVAFSAKPNGPPDVAKLPQGSAIIQVIDVKPASTPTFDEIRAQVEGDFKQDQAIHLLAQKTQELADRAHAAHDLKKAAKELGATVKTSEMLTPISQAPDLGAMSGPAAVAFDLKQGEISGPLQIGNSGAVLSVVEKKEATPEEFAKTKDQLRDQLAERKRQERVQFFVANLRARMEKEGKIKINKDEWNRVMGKAPTENT